MSTCVSISLSNCWNSLNFIDDAICILIHLLYEVLRIENNHLPNWTHLIIRCVKRQEWRFRDFGSRSNQFRSKLRMLISRSMWQRKWPSNFNISNWCVMIFGIESYIETDLLYSLVRSKWNVWVNTWRKMLCDK